MLKLFISFLQVEFSVLSSDNTVIMVWLQKQLGMVYENIMFWLKIPVLSSQTQLEIDPEVSVSPVLSHLQVLKNCLLLRLNDWRPACL